MSVYTRELSNQVATFRHECTAKQALGIYSPLPGPNSTSFNKYLLKQEAKHMQPSTGPPAAGLELAASNAGVAMLPSLKQFSYHLCLHTRTQKDSKGDQPTSESPQTLKSHSGITTTRQ